MRRWWISRRPGGAWWRASLVLAALSLLPSRPAVAASQCFGPYTPLAASTYYPSEAGDDVRDWPGAFTTNLSLASGTLTAKIQAKLDGGTWVDLGTVTSTSGSQFAGPWHRLRVYVTACSGCDAAIITCATKGE